MVQARAHGWQLPTWPLTPLDESWERALCVVAHPDDLEFGAAAAVARWTGQGKSSSTAWSPAARPASTAWIPTSAAGPRGGAAPVRRGRRRRHGGVPRPARRRAGVRRPLAQVITASVRRHRPEIVVTGNFRDTWGGANLNQADHIATGRAVVDAVRDAGNRWIFRDQVERRPRALGRRPRGLGVRLARRRPRRRHHRHLRRGGRLAGGAPRVHRRAGLGALRRARVPRGHARQAGQRMGVAFAAPFEVFPMGWGGEIKTGGRSGRPLTPFRGLVTMRPDPEHRRH